MGASTESPEQATVSRGRGQGVQHFCQVPQTHYTRKDLGIAGGGAEKGGGTSEQCMSLSECEHVCT